MFRLYDPEVDEFGKDGYPLVWHRTIKHRVRREAGYRCVRCKHPYESGQHGTGEWSPCDDQCNHERYDRERAYHIRTGRWFANWRILTVHHLDMNKANCRWWNLVPLCQRCHLTVQGKVVMSRVWPWEHTEWFKPYVAGFYAYAYLDEDLTAPEVMERLDELLDLERMVT